MQYHLLHFKEIDSTNSYLKNTYRLLDNFTFVSTDYQSKGKGREDRVWQSESGENLMFSFLIKNEELMKLSSILSIMIAVEVVKEIEKYDVNNVSVKWPNDVLINDKKVCGILLEGQVPEYLVIGVGLNVNQKEFPDGLRRPATSLSLELNEDVNLDELKERLFKNIVNNFSNPQTDAYLDYFREHNYLLNKRVRVLINNEPFIGEVVGVDDNFCLQILSSDMILHIDSGEIEIL
ncbi:MAG: biotin--[acetyl-CoA-carboxylase] ligase [Bacilli bacterium]|nr:biotin--[acetyl-CoA-carboxylase] ligase [Bacilli bacterium]